MANRLKSKKKFENVYVQKDLIYRQRQKLSERRHRGNVTKVLGRMNEDGNNRISSTIDCPSGTSGIGKRGVGRRGSHSHVHSTVRRNVYSNTHVGERYLN